MIDYPEGVESPRKLKLGDQLVYSTNFGMGPTVTATITHMEVTEPREKYGTDAEEVDMELVRQNRVVFSTDNRQWCYSEQVDIEKTIRVN